MDPVTSYGLIFSQRKVIKEIVADELKNLLAADVANEVSDKIVNRIDDLVKRHRSALNSGN